MPQDREQSQSPRGRLPASSAQSGSENSRNNSRRRSLDTPNRQPSTPRRPSDDNKFNMVPQSRSAVQQSQLQNDTTPRSSIDELDEEFKRLLKINSPVEHTSVGEDNTDSQREKISERNIESETYSDDNSNEVKDNTDSQREKISERNIESETYSDDNSNEVKDNTDSQREKISERNIESETYSDDKSEEGIASKKFFEFYGQAVTKAYNYVIQVPSLGGHEKLDGHTKKWVELWQEHLSKKSPKLMAAKFGYVIESLVSKPGMGFHPGTITGYTVVAQAVRGGTRPDLVLMSPTGKDIAWIDITASSSVGHIHDKDDWAKKVKNFAEVTYPSLSLETLAFMRKNKDSHAVLSDEDFKKRQKEASELYEKQKKELLELGKTFKKEKYKEEMKDKGIKKEIADLMPEQLHKFIQEKLKDKLNIENLEEKLVPSILSAMEVAPDTWGYTTGFPTSKKAGEAWLIDNALQSLLQE